MMKTWVWLRHMLTTCQPNVSVRWIFDSSLLLLPLPLPFFNCFLLFMFATNQKWIPVFHQRAGMSIIPSLEAFATHKWTDMLSHSS